ncbi:MAG: nitroreductase [Anaerolineales bacterium]|nr:nitroreductase [Anaerolineales bacterium]
MDFMSLIETRYSVRGYRQDTVEEEKLNLVLEAARLAPTAANRQPFRIIVMNTEGREEELKRIYHREWFRQAPYVICVCGVHEEAWIGEDGISYLHVDVAIVMDHLILAATELGLGTCWIGAFRKDVAREVLGLPEGVDPIVMTPLGYPSDEPEPKERRSLSELVYYEHWRT